MSEPLKSCPFCGSSYKWLEHKPYDNGVLCNGCGVWMPSRVSTEPSSSHGALEMWNTRADDSKLSALESENAALRAECQMKGEQQDGF